MTVTNWRKKIAAALVAGGLWVPSAAWAVEIPLGDASFEDIALPTNVSAGAQYAYARDGRAGKFSYRPANPPKSAWVSRPDDIFPDGMGGFQFYVDGGPLNSNWIYTSAYAETVVNNPNGGHSNPGNITAGRRPAPRTGNQAMHGAGFSSGQELTDVYEPYKTYTFSVWAQGDSNAEIYGGSPPIGWQSRAYLYLYDASVSFHNDAIPKEDYHNPAYQTTLTRDLDEYDQGSSEFTYWPHDRFAPSEPNPDNVNETHPGNFVNRDPNWTAVQSKGGWQKISLSHRVLPGAPEAGHPIGVAFRAYLDAAIDDASLTVGGGVADLTGDTLINAQDWMVLRSHQLGDLSGLSAGDAYLQGDITGDLKNDNADFVAFKTAFDAANGAGSFAAMVASIPEPSSALIAATGGLFALAHRRRTK